MGNKKSDKELIERMLKAFYYMGLRKSKKLKLKVEDQMSKNIWAPVAESMAEYRTFLTARKNLGMDDEKAEGLLHANESTVTRGELNKILNERDKHDVEAYAVYKSSGRGNPSKKWICFNCAKLTDHSWKNCPEDPVTCTTCHKLHNVLVHDQLVKKKLYRPIKSVTNTRPSPRQANVAGIDSREDSSELQDEHCRRYMEMYEASELQANIARARFEEDSNSDQDDPDRLLNFHSTIKNMNDDSESDEGEEVVYVRSNSVITSIIDSTHDLMDDST